MLTKNMVEHSNYDNLEKNQIKELNLEIIEAIKTLDNLDIDFINSRFNFKAIDKKYYNNYLNSRKIIQYLDCFDFWQYEFKYFILFVYY